MGSETVGKQKVFVLISPKNRTVYNFRGDLIREIQSKGYEVIVTGPNKDDIDIINGLGVRFFEIPMKKNGVNALEDLRYIRALKRLFKEVKPDVTLGYTIKPVIYGAIAAKKAGVKRIYSMVTGAGYVFTAKSLKGKLIGLAAKILYKKGFKAADTVIFQNGDDLDEFTGIGLLKKEKCVTVNGSGVNTVKYPCVPLPEKTTFFMLARILKSKGVAEYLSAAEKVKKCRPDVRFMLLGKIEAMPGALSEKEVMPYVERGIIEYFGESPDIPPYYAMSSVFVLPSYREGTPRTVLEAMSSGRCIITTDVPGCRETVKEGYNGFLVPPKDADALAEKMILLADNPDLIREMGANSRTLCEEKYEVSRVNAQMLSYMNIT